MRLFRRKLKEKNNARTVSYQVDVSGGLCCHSKATPPLSQIGTTVALTSILFLSFALRACLADLNST